MPKQRLSSSAGRRSGGGMQLDQGEPLRNKVPASVDCFRREAYPYETIA
jgi:hypothetical protein